MGVFFFFKVTLGVGAANQVGDDESRPGCSSADSMLGGGGELRADLEKEGAVY